MQCEYTQIYSCSLPLAEPIERDAVALTAPVHLHGSILRHRILCRAAILALI